MPTTADKPLCTFCVLGTDQREKNPTFYALSFLLQIWCVKSISFNVKVFADLFSHSSMFGFRHRCRTRVRLRVRVRVRVQHWHPEDEICLGSTSEPGGNSIYERTKYFKPKHTWSLLEKWLPWTLEKLNPPLPAQLSRLLPLDDPSPKIKRNSI